MTLWIIGFLFTLGYCGWFNKEMPWRMVLATAILVLAFWPILLGMNLGDQFED